ncbi:type II toxin-antitoxin system CcdA family antitoxin [Sphingomonas sp. Leaf4]|uniref:type II toxin-antitoxin system CcdA family antitoxin n=1 Tax=Sphingomonas sp. Leaf4 TaxID=2876553 RepID=UPI001E3A9CCB|nr:type II toxin-antitoxin system CcdA family antitoxin [Sphingomonas sp. Leaf4]
MGAEGRIDPAMIADAQALGVDVVAACEAGLTRAIREAREAEWLTANREAIAEFNNWVDHNELPLAKYRMF